MLVKEILGEYFLEGVHDPYNDIVIFMAGIPGAGKTYVANKIFYTRGFRPVNIDLFSEMRIKRGEDYKRTYQRDKELSKKRMELFIKQKLGFVVDFTNRDIDRVIRLKKELEDKGYRTAMVFVDAPPEEAYERVKERREKIGRDVTYDYFLETVENLKKNFENMKKIFYPNFFHIVNSKKTPDPTKNIDQVERKILKFLKNGTR